MRMYEKWMKYAIFELDSDPVIRDDAPEWAKKAYKEYMEREKVFLDSLSENTIIDY